MKFTLKTEEFRNAVSELNTILVPATTYRAISFLLIKAVKGDGLYLQATDYEINLKKKIDANVLEEGSIGVPGKFLNLALKDFEAEEITVEQTGPENIMIRSDNKTLNFVCLSENEYPAFPEFQKKETFIVPSEVLRDGIKKTSYAVSRDTSNLILLGSLWEFDFEVKKLTMVATDSHRLVVNRAIVEFQKTPKENLRIIVPEKLLNYLSSSLPAGDIPVTIVIPDKEGKIAFYFENTEIIGKLIVGAYPEYAPIIPNESGMKVIKIDRNEVLRAIRFVSVLAEKKSYNVNMSFTKEELVVYTDLSEVGEAKQSIPLTDNNDVIKITFNINYMKDALTWFDEDVICFQYSDTRSPVMIKGVGNENYFSIIMPIRPI